MEYLLQRFRDGLQGLLRRRDGQTMIEYMVVTVLFLGLMTVMGIFVYALRQHSDRVLDLVASEYP